MVGLSYFLLPFAREIWSFMILIIGIGLGYGMIKPSTLGVVSKNLNYKNEAFGWGLYILLLNIAVFTVTPLASFLKNISWTALFWGASGIMFLQLFSILFIKNIPSKEKSSTIIIQAKELFSGLFQPKILIFILLISGFTMIYMQFYETLPHFILDWIKTGEIALMLGLPKSMMMETDLGSMISYQYLYMINPLLTTIFILIISHYFRKKDKINVLAIGMILVSIGWMITGMSSNGAFLLIGMVVYSFGEMTTNPKLTEYMSSLSPNGKKSTFMGYLSLAYLIGYSIGALFGGYMYQKYGEKAGLAADYLADKFAMVGIDKTQSFGILMEQTGLNSTQVTVLLWDYYSPWLAWLPFFVIGIFCSIGLIWYKNKIKL